MKKGLALLLVLALACLLTACDVRGTAPSASAVVPDTQRVLVVKSSAATSAEPAESLLPAEPEETPDAPWYTTAGNVVASYYDGALNKIREERDGVVRYGIADRDGRVILPATYLWIGVLDENRLVATAGDASGLEFSRAWIFDAEGNAVSAGEYNSIEYYRKADDTLTSYGVAFKDEGFYLVGRDGNVLDGRVWEWLAFEDETTLTGFYQGQALAVDMTDGQPTIR